LIRRNWLEPQSTFVCRSVQSATLKGLLVEGVKRDLLTRTDIPFSLENRFKSRCKFRSGIGLDKIAVRTHSQGVFRHIETAILAE